MDISLRAGAPERKLGYAEIKQRQEAALALAAVRKRKVEAGASQARTSPRMEATARIKADARAKLMSIRERIEILKKLYSANPKELARALAQVFKELKMAVKAFRDAGGQEMAMAGETAGVPSDQTEAAEDSDGAEAPKAGAPDAAAQAGAGLYEDTVRAMREGIGREGLEFAKEVRGLATKIKELLEAARGQAKIRKPDTETDGAFEDADKALKALNEALDDMETEIHRAVPSAGLMISLAA